MAKANGAEATLDYQCFPGVYALVGIRNEEKGIIYQNHHSKFNVEETVLKRGAALYAQFAIDYLEERDK